MSDDDNVRAYPRVRALRAHAMSNAVIVKNVEKHAGGFEEGPFFDSIPHWLVHRVQDHLITLRVTPCADYAEWTFVDYKGDTVIASVGDMIMLRADPKFDNDQKLELVNGDVLADVLKAEEVIRNAADQIGEMLIQGIDVSVGNLSGVARVTLLP